MTGRASDAELLEQTAEWLSRLAETIERVTERLADSLAKMQAAQAAMRDELDALSKREQLHYNDLDEYIRNTREAFPDKFA